MKNSWKTIISIGAEGGSIKLAGKEVQPGKWIFKKIVNEIDYDLKEEPNQGTTKGIRTFVSGSSKQASEANTWEKALQILDHYPCPRLRPREIHPEFRKQIWSALQSRLRDKNLFDSYQIYQWADQCFPGISRQVVTLATWLQISNHVTVLTGAGMSTESNIPDFRSKDGWWRSIDPRTVATTDAMENQYDLFHEFYSMRINGLKQCIPHKGHEILAAWEQNRLIQAIATQNVDEFHSKAGNRNVYELHGSIHKIRCANCSKPASKEAFLNKENCIHCGGKLRPGVVLFGEMLPEDSWKASLSHIRKSDLVIVIGTSLEVYPASQLPHMTNGKTVYINAEIGDHSPEFDLIIQGKAGEILKQVDELLL